MKYAAVLFLLAAAIVWAHTHTDEIPVVFGLLGLAALAMGSFFPRRFAISAAVLGLAPIAAELLVRLGALHAPWPPTPVQSLPLIALVCQIPAFLGASLGWFARRGLSPSPARS